MAEDKNAMNAWFMFVAPPLIFLALYQLFPAISAHLVTDGLGLVIYLCVALLIGFLLFRNARTVRDHEWHRRKHIKKLQKDYAAEDRGVWSKADLVIGELEADAAGAEVGQMSAKALQRLDGDIGALIGSKLTDEVESEDSDHDKVELFTESEHVVRSTQRITGESDPVESVQGVTHQAEEPDNKGVISGVLDKLKEQAPAKVAEPVAEAELSQSDWYAQEMMGGGGGQTSSPTAAAPVMAGNRCPSCGHSNPAAESYCENCGSNL